VSPPPIRLAIAVLAAARVLGTAFSGPRERFWPRMTALGASLAAVSLVASPTARSVRLRPLDVAAGLGSAAVLYGVFTIGDRVVQRVLPNGADEVARIYSLGALEPPGRIAARLALIGAAEELFWRGWVQDALAARLGRWPGAAAAAAVYAAAHAGSGSLVLVGAAGAVGAQWSALRASGVRLGGLVVGHLAWDVWIFLIRPTSGRGSRGRR
jgi:uncharacterized protein